MNIYPPSTARPRECTKGRMDGCTERGRTAWTSTLLHPRKSEAVKHIESPGGLDGLDQDRTEPSLRRDSSRFSWVVQVALAFGASTAGLQPKFRDKEQRRNSGESLGTLIAKDRI